MLRLRPLPAALLLTALIAGAGAVRAPAQDPAPILVVGDSLAVGLQPDLDALLAPRAIVWDARSGRTTPEGLVRLRARLREVTPRTVIISLGTNDGPDPRRFASRIRRTLQTIPATDCVVWLDINRPPRKGPYDALNQVLYAAAARDPRLVVVHWDRAVRRGNVALPDGLHPGPAGFRYRSLLVAGAVVRGCSA